MSFFLYILRSECSSRFYIGHAEDVEKRLLEHNRDRVVATRRKGPGRLIFSESIATRSEAARREIQIKQMKSRTWIEGLVARASR